MNTPEYPTYRGAIDFLEENQFDVICSCPPRGGGSQHKKCIFPKINKRDKGSRDEIDIIAYKNNVIFLIECKPFSCDSKIKINLHGENDVQKLIRIKNSFSIKEFNKMLAENYNFKKKFEHVIVATASMNASEITTSPDIATIDFGKKIITLNSNREADWFNQCFDCFEIRVL